MPVLRLTSVLLAAALLSPPLAVAVERSADPPSTAPAVAPEPPVGLTAEDPAADELLARLEASHRDAKSFAADLRVIEIDELLGRREIRNGSLVYKLSPEPVDVPASAPGEAPIRLEGKRFAVRFDDLIVGRERSQRVESFVFDGRWLYEVDPAVKQLIAREIVPPGHTLDPLKLGEGPFPLPVGQARAEVLARFTVISADVPAEGFLSDLTNVQGVRLAPRPGTPSAGTWASLSIFYDRATLLPIGVEVIKHNADRQIVRLSNLRRDPVLDRALAERLRAPETDASWLVDRRSWSDPDDSSAGSGGGTTDR